MANSVIQAGIAIDYGLVTILDGFYCETVSRAYVFMIKKGNRGVCSIIGTIKTGQTVTSGETYSIASTSYSAMRYTEEICDKGKVFIEAGDNVVKFIPTNNISPYNSLEISLLYQLA